MIWHAFDRCVAPVPPSPRAYARVNPDCPAQLHQAASGADVVIASISRNLAINLDVDNPARIPVTLTLKMGSPTNGHATEHGAIPTVDFAEWSDTAPPEQKQKIASQLVHACQTVGFVYIINHRLPHEKIQEAFTWSKKLFDLKQEDKLLAPHPPGHAVHRGYSWPGLEKVSNSMGNEDDSELATKLRQVSDMKVGERSPYGP